MARASRTSSLLIVLTSALAVELGCGGASNNTDLTGATSGAAGDAGSKGDGATTTDAAVNNPNGAPGGNTTSLPCGRETCALPAQTCCATQANNTTTFACTTTACSTGGTTDRTASLKCTSSVNCVSGFVCCATRTNDNVVSSCSTSCDRGIQLCDPSAPASATGCIGNRKCATDKVSDLGLPSTFGTCSN